MFKHIALALMFVSAFQHGEFGYTRYGRSATWMATAVCELATTPRRERVTTYQVAISPSY